MRSMGLRGSALPFLLVLVVIFGLLPAFPAEAGRRAFLYTFDTERLPQGDAELEQWIWSKTSPRDSDAFGPGWLWFGPIYGLSREVEIAFPWEVVVTPAGTQLTNFTSEARIGLLNPAPGSNELGSVLRLYYQYNFSHPTNAGRFGKPWIGANLITSYGQIDGSHVTLDVGTYFDAFGQKDLIHQTLGLGYTHPIRRELRVGVEYFHDLSLGKLNPDSNLFVAGPVAAISRGAVWMTFGALLGLHKEAPAAMPRLIFGVHL